LDEKPSSTGQTASHDPDTAYSGDRDMAAASAPETKEAVGPPEAMTSSTPADAAPPDGGVRAWTQALGSFVLYFNTWGM
jgi:hypothetical protein